MYIFVDLFIHESEQSREAREVRQSTIYKGNYKFVLHNVRGLVMVEHFTRKGGFFKKDICKVKVQDVQTKEIKFISIDSFYELVSLNQVFRGNIMNLEQGILGMFVTMMSLSAYMLSNFVEYQGYQRVSASITNYCGGGIMVTLLSIEGLNNEYNIVYSSRTLHSLEYSDYFPELLLQTSKKEQVIGIDVIGSNVYLQHFNLNYITNKATELGRFKYIIKKKKKTKKIISKYLLIGGV